MLDTLLAYKSIQWAFSIIVFLFWLFWFYLYTRRLVSERSRHRTTGVFTTVSRDGIPARSSAIKVFNLSSPITIILLVTSYFIYSGGFFSAAVLPKTAALDIPKPFREIPSNDKLVVFLHGWKGDPQDTWGFFPKLLTEDSRFNDCDVLILNYPTYLFKRNLTIMELSVWLYDSLPTMVKLEKYKKVAFVAHSMGGLIARELKLLELTGVRINGYSLLLEIATPHLGANYSLLAAVLGISKSQTKDMGKGSNYLRGLDARWGRIKKELKPITKAFYSAQDEIVEISSATHLCDSSTPFTGGGHTDIVKPETLSDERYTLPAEDLFGFFKL